MTRVVSLINSGADVDYVDEVHVCHSLPLPKPSGHVEPSLHALGTLHGPQVLNLRRHLVCSVKLVYTYHNWSNMNSTGVLNLQRAQILESACAIKTHSNYVNGKYMEDSRQKMETKEKEACYLTSSRIPGRV